MNSRNQAILQQLRGGLVVSCQALPEEPLHSSYIMSRMAYAAYLGGAVGIRANTVEDIAEIRKTVSLPIIGIIKRVYEDHPELYITPTMKEVGELIAWGGGDRHGRHPPSPPRRGDHRDPVPRSALQIP